MSRCVKHDWYGSQGGTHGVPVPPCPWCMQGKLRERIAELEAVVEAAEKDKAEIAKDAQYISSRCLKAEARIAELEAVAEAVIALQDDMDYPYGHPMLEVEKALRAAGYLTVIR